MLTKYAMDDIEKMMYMAMTTVAIDTVNSMNKYAGMTSKKRPRGAEEQENHERIFTATGGKYKGRCFACGHVGHYPSDANCPSRRQATVGNMHAQIMLMQNNFADSVFNRFAVTPRTDNASPQY